MQPTSSGWPAVQKASYRPVSFGVLASFQKQTASGINFFTIGSSTIGGNDIIKGSGANVTFFDKYLYTDYSPYVLSWSVDRQLGQYPYGTIMAQADVELDNTSQLFTPNYDATIGSGIFPSRPVKLSVGFNGETLNQFTGFTGQPEMSVTERKVTMHAFDAFDYINNFTLTTSGQGTTVSGILSGYTFDQFVAYALNVMGFSSNQYVLDQSLNQPIGFITLTNQKMGDLFAQGVEAEQGMLFIDENGVIRFWNRQHFLTTSGVGTKFDFNYSNMTSLQYQNAPILNDVTVESSVRALSNKQKIWELSTPTILNPGFTDVFADFSDNDGALPVVSVDAPVYTTSGVSSVYTTNLAADGSGATMNAYISVANTYLFGTTYRVTFNNSFTSAIYLMTMVLQGVPAKVTQKVHQSYLDQTSVSNYGRNPANNGQPLVLPTVKTSTDFIQNVGDANSLAYTLVNQSSGGRRKYVAKVFADPSLQIGDYGTVTIPDTGEVKNMFITGVKTIMDGRVGLEQEVTLEERKVNKYFQIGVSAIGGGDSIAP